MNEVKDIQMKCKKIIEEILDEYQSKGYIDKKPNMKGWFGSSFGKETGIEVCGKLNWGIRLKNFSLSFNTYEPAGRIYKEDETGVFWTFDALAAFNPNYPEASTSYLDGLKDEREKWVEIVRNLINDINEKTAFLRFSLKKYFEESGT